MCNPLRLTAATDLDVSDKGMGINGLPSVTGRRADSGMSLESVAPECPKGHREASMKRRDFLKSTAALAGASMVSAPAVFSPAKAQSRQETLLFVTESGPNNFDIHGVGTNRPGYEVSWNCYDRLMSHGVKTLADGTQSYDRDKFVPELAEEWK